MITSTFYVVFQDTLLTWGHIELHQAGRHLTRP